MEPVPLGPHHVAWWFHDPSSEPQLVNVNPPPSMPGVAPTQAVVTNAAGENQPAGVHLAWKPSPDDLAHMASGGTLWVTSLGGVLPTRVDVQPPDQSPRAWVGRVISVIEGARPGQGATIRVELGPRARPPRLGEALVLVAEGAPAGPAVVPAPPVPPGLLSPPTAPDPETPTEEP